MRRFYGLVPFTCCLLALTLLMGQPPIRIFAQEQQQPETERKRLTSAQQREIEASIYVRKWAEDDARENKLLIKIADIGSVPIFREDFEDHYVEYFDSSPDLRRAAQAAAVTADAAKRTLVRMGADAAPALAAALFSPQINVRFEADEILDHLGSGALKSLIRSATDVQSPNRIASYLEVRSRFPLAEISGDVVSTPELLELLKGDTATCQTVIQELATRKSDASTIIPVLLQEHEDYRLPFAVTALCYLDAPSQDILTAIESGLIQFPSDHIVYLGAAMSLFERREVTEAQLRAMVSGLSNPAARRSVDDELPRFLFRSAQSQVTQKPTSDDAHIQKLLQEFNIRPFMPQRQMSIDGEFTDLSPVFHQLVHANTDAATRTEVAKALVATLERETQVTKLRSIPLLPSLGTAAWPLAPLMIVLVKNKRRDIDSLKVAVEAMTVFAVLGGGDFPKRNAVLTTLSEVLREDSRSDVRPPATCKMPDDYRDWYGIARQRAVRALGQLKPSGTVVDEVLRPLLPATNLDNHERRLAAEAILQARGYDEEAIHALRSLAGYGLLSSLTPLPKGISESDQAEIRRTVQDWTAKGSGKTVDLLIQRLVTNADGSMEARRTIDSLGSMGAEALAAIPVLERALTCLDGNLRGEAVLALARINPANPHIRNVLPDLLRAAESNVRYSAREAQQLIQE